MPDGDMIATCFANNGGAPTWFAVSDGGLGFIPWGFWQVAVYPLGQVPPSAVGNLAFAFTEADPTDPSAAIAGKVWSQFNALRAQAIAAGFNVQGAGIGISEGDTQLGAPLRAGQFKPTLWSSRFTI